MAVVSVQVARTVGIEFVAYGLAGTDMVALEVVDIAAEVRTAALAGHTAHVARAAEDYEDVAGGDADAAAPAAASAVEVVHTGCPLVSRKPIQETPGTPDSDRNSIAGARFAGSIVLLVVMAGQAIVHSGDPVFAADPTMTLVVARQRSRSDVVAMVCAAHWALSDAARAAMEAHQILRSVTTCVVDKARHTPRLAWGALAAVYSSLASRPVQYCPLSALVATEAVSWLLGQSVAAESAQWVADIAAAVLC